MSEADAYTSWRNNYNPADIVEPLKKAPPQACLTTPLDYMPRIRVANITVDGTTLTVPRSQLLEHISDDDEVATEYSVTFTTMPVPEYEALGEFSGF